MQAVKVKSGTKGKIIASTETPHQHPSSKPTEETEDVARWTIFIGPAVCLLMVIVLGPLQGRALVQTNRTGLVLLRGACLTAMSLLIATALSRMPVAEVTAVTFLAPMLVVLLARQRLQVLSDFIACMILACRDESFD